MERIILDNGGYDELLENAVSRIQKLCPDWKNTRQSDPGITVIQLMAALTEIQNYTADSISERHKEAYIKLLGGKKHGVKCAWADIGLRPELIKGQRIIIGRRNVFEYSGGKRFIQKETLVRNVEFDCDGEVNSFNFPFWAAQNGTINVFKRDSGKRWRPAEFKLEKAGKPLLIETAPHEKGGYRVEFEPQEAGGTLSIKITKPEKGKYRAVFYDCERINDYYKESGIAQREDEVLELDETTSGVTMQVIKIPPPKIKNIMPIPLTLKLWANYGGHYEEIGFNPLKDNAIMLGNGRDFPILKAGGKIEAYSLVLTKGEIRLSAKQPIFKYGRKKDGGVRGDKIDEARIEEHFSEGRNAETTDEALLRTNTMVVPKTCVTTADYTERISELYNDEIEKLKVKSDGALNKIIVYALLKDSGKTLAGNIIKRSFSEWKSKLLKKLLPCKLLTVSLDIREAARVPVTVEGEIALDAESSRIRDEISRAVKESCDSDIGDPVTAHKLIKKISEFTQVKRINRLSVKYAIEIENDESVSTYLNDFSVKYIFL
jgi:hypothetical protein